MLRIVIVCDSNHHCKHLALKMPNYANPDIAIDS